MFDALQPFEMADAVLRHRGFPFIDSSKEGLGAEAEDAMALNGSVSATMSDSRSSDSRGTWRARLPRSSSVTAQGLW